MASKWWRKTRKICLNSCSWNTWWSQNRQVTIVMMIGLKKILSIRTFISPGSQFRIRCIFYGASPNTNSSGCLSDSTSIWVAIRTSNVSILVNIWTSCTIYYGAKAENQLRSAKRYKNYPLISLTSTRMVSSPLPISCSYQIIWTRIATSSERNFSPWLDIMIKLTFLSTASQVTTTPSELTNTKSSSRTTAALL